MIRSLSSAGQQALAPTSAATVMVLAAVGRAARARRRVVSGSISGLVFDHCPAGSALADAAGRLRGANPTLARWCGSTPDAMVGRHLADLVDPGDASVLAVALAPGGPASAEVRLLAAGGARWVRLLVAHVPAAGSAAALCVIQVEDAGEHRATTARLAHDARHDALTGLPNRRALAGELEALLAAPGAGGALVMIDVDGFKAVNDQLGHAGGDELLCVVAERLRSCLRPGDVAGRLGGDEMLIIARAVGDDAGAQAIGQRVLAALLGPVTLHAGTVAVRASIGVRRITATDTDAALVLREADAALYDAKADGGGCARSAGAAQPRSVDTPRQGGAPCTPTPVRLSA